MNVSSATAAASAGTTPQTTQASQDQFLTLLVTQIQNQNPLDPMSNEEFTSQLTQFSMLEELEEMNGNMETNMSYSQSLNNTMLLGLVGREASVAGDTATVVGDEISSTRLEAGGPGTATVKVLDENGEVVRTFLQSVDSGWNDLTWDGRDDGGDRVDDGDYTLEVSVADAGGESVAHQLYETGRVDSIRFENNLAVLSVNGRDYYASEIAEVGL